MQQVTPNSHFADSGYVRRIVDDEIDNLLPGLPAIHLDGPKAVGKTSTALQRAGTVHRLSRPRERLRLQGNPERILDGIPPILVDEWQQVPSTWDTVKDAVDVDPSGGRFILTGSMPRAQTHSGAGRITTVRMRPLTLPERAVCTPAVSLRQLLTGQRGPIAGSCELTLEHYTDLILASGFPGLQHLSGDHLRAQLDGYLTRIVDADMESESGRVVRRPETVMGWLRAYAAATSTTATWETIRDAASSGSRPAKTTTMPYRDVLTRLQILDVVEPWIPSNNHLSQVGMAPKHNLADPALAARLVGLEADALLDDEGPDARPGSDTFLGQLFESLAAMSLRTFASPSGASVLHLRTHRGTHEVDFIVKRGDGKVVAIEVKLSPIVESSDVRHLVWLKRELGDGLLDSAIVTTGQDAYRRRDDGIAVVPLGLLGP